MNHECEMKYRFVVTQVIKPGDLVRLKGFESSEYGDPRGVEGSNGPVWHYDEHDVWRMSYDEVGMVIQTMKPTDTLSVPKSSTLTLVVCPSGRGWIPTSELKKVQ